MSTIGHLQQEDLSSVQIEHLRQFGEWVNSASFEPIRGGIERCIDDDLAKKVNPLLLELGTTALV